MVQHGLVLSKKIVVLRQLISASALLALSTFSSIISINPKDADAYNNRGNAKYNLGDKQEAIAD